MKWGVLSCLPLWLQACAMPLPAGASPPCDTPLDSRVGNACVVAPGVLWRGAKPDEQAASALLSKGVKTIVNLEWLHDDRDALSRARTPSDAHHDAQYFRVKDWELLVVLTPSVADDKVAHFLAITRTQATPIYVHCRSGQNRTGVMVAAYRVFNGMPIEDAIAEMKRYNGFWAEPDARYIRTLTLEKRQAMEPAITRWQTRLKAEARVICRAGTCQVQDLPQP